MHPEACFLPICIQLTYNSSLSIIQNEDNRVRKVNMPEKLGMNMQCLLSHHRKDTTKTQEKRNP